MDLYLVELMEYYYDFQTESINQDEVKLLGLYKTEAEARERIEKEINLYREASKTNVDVLRDEVLQENCIEALDVVSEEARVTIIGTKVSTGDSDVKVDHDRINYFFNYDK